jgi:hypothetical protein
MLDPLAVNAVLIQACRTQPKSIKENFIAPVLLAPPLSSGHLRKLFIANYL